MCRRMCKITVFLIAENLCARAIKNCMCKRMCNFQNVCLLVCTDVCTIADFLSPPQSLGFAKVHTDVGTDFPYARHLPEGKMTTFFRAKKYTMEIKVRNLDKNVVAAIDDQAKAQNKSRNEYLVEQLTLLARAPELKRQEDKYGALVNTVVNVVRENTEIMDMVLGGTNENE